MKVNLLYIQGILYTFWSGLNNFALLNTNIIEYMQLTALRNGQNLINIHTVNSTPSLKDLQQYVTPQYAIQWRVIGIQLGLSSETLDIIECDNYYKIIPCCNAMLKQWLQMDITASWEKLLTIIESSAMSRSAPNESE